MAEEQDVLDSLDLADELEAALTSDIDGGDVDGGADPAAAADDLDTGDDGVAGQALDEGDDLDDLLPERETKSAKPAAAADPATDTPDADPAAAAPITRAEDGAVWNATAKRWQLDGKFVEGDAPAEAAAAAAPAEGVPAAGEPAAAEPKWEPLSVTVDRAQVPVEEAQVMRANGSVFIGVPEAKYEEFQRRIVRGYAAERMWRQLDTGLKEVESLKAEIQNAPKPRSETEIEADIMLAAIKPHLADLFDERDMENLTLKVKLAQKEERENFSRASEERRTQATAGDETTRLETEGLASTIVEIVDTYGTELAGLTEADLKEVFAELQPIRRALIWKEGEEWMRNTEYVYNKLKEKQAAKTARAASPAPPVTVPATPPAGGTTAKPDAAAERFNKGQDTAANPKPVTTSVKARRAADSRPRPAAPPAATRDTRTQAQIDEDNYRKATSSFMRSDSLDFDDGTDS